MLNRKLSVLVVHVGRRDKYEVAFAFAERGFDVHLVTDFYFQPRNWFGMLAKFVFGDSVYKRYRNGLSVNIHSSILLMFTDYSERFLPRNEYVNRLRNYSLGRLAIKVSKIVNVHRAYFYLNSGLDYYKKKISYECKTILFQMHPHADSVVQIYHDYISLRPEVAALLKSQEEEMTERASYYNKISNDAFLADEIITTSSFCKSTLVRVGIESKKICVVPYGFESVEIDNSRSCNSNKTISSNYNLRLAFVGQFVIRKGVYELVLLAARRADIQITFFTRDKSYATTLINNWIGFIPNNLLVCKESDDRLMWELVAKMDFLILPSLVEGFGLVISEAMSRGIPVIGSKNSAASDLINHKLNGVILDGVTTDDIESTINDLLNDRECWKLWGESAKRDSKSRTWEKFRKDLIGYAV